MDDQLISMSMCRVNISSPLNGKVLLAVEAVSWLVVQETAGRVWHAALWVWLGTGGLFKCWGWPMRGQAGEAAQHYWAVGGCGRTLGTRPPHPGTRPRVRGWCQPIRPHSAQPRVPASEASLAEPAEAEQDSWHRVTTERSTTPRVRVLALRRSCNNESNLLNKYCTSYSQERVMVIVAWQPTAMRCNGVYMRLHVNFNF